MIDPKALYNILKCLSGNEPNRNIVRFALDFSCTALPKNLRYVSAVHFVLYFKKSTHQLGYFQTVQKFHQSTAACVYPLQLYVLLLQSYPAHKAYLLNQIPPWLILYDQELRPNCFG
ncbi:hypothetical protein M514_21051 [Trichuris suis]|uniref:Uncharacterized protein n=1 Tax=Trichuris suis TaxID=68888 RepID=A0A085NB56_9BILA|nr:hypothetical protein M514_21051 [Trichuris suis]